MSWLAGRRPINQPDTQLSLGMQVPVGQMRWPCLAETGVLTTRSLSLTMGALKSYK